LSFLVQAGPHTIIRIRRINSGKENVLIISNKRNKYMKNAGFIPGVFTICWI
jgi:hypothetical protein